MFHYLKDKPRILVTGLMRSGTTICAEMVAHDTGHSAVREESLLSRPVDTLPKETILQAPVLLRRSLELKAKGWHIIVVLREFKDCVDSTKRMLAGRYPSKLDPVLVENLLKEQEYLRALVDSDMCPMVIHYEDLCHHPLWVADRKGWDPRQTKSGPFYHTEIGP